MEPPKIWPRCLSDLEGQLLIVLQDKTDREGSQQGVVLEQCWAEAWGRKGVSLNQDVQGKVGSISKNTDTAMFVELSKYLFVFKTHLCLQLLHLKSRGNRSDLIT